MPSLVNSIASSITTQATSYSSNLPAALKTDTSTQMVSTVTLPSRGTTLLSLLLTTSGSFISNQTSTIRSTVSNIPFTTQRNSNTTSPIREYINFSFSRIIF
jgi:hypothetical protein